jgi:hypothetical protein
MRFVPTESNITRKDVLPSGSEGTGGAHEDTLHEDGFILVTLQDTADPGPLVSTTPTTTLGTYLGPSLPKL